MDTQQNEAPTGTHELRDDHPHFPLVIVAPSGATETEGYLADETVGAVLQHAQTIFATQGQIDPSRQYVLTNGQTALDNALSLEAAGVKAGDRLNLRSKEIPGDGDAPGTV